MSDIPTYEYECTQCGKAQEFYHGPSVRMVWCPLCRGKLKKLISGGVATHFKGSGFYTTDYKDKRKSKAR